MRRLTMINKCGLCGGMIRGNKCVNCGMPDQSQKYNLNTNVPKPKKDRNYEGNMSQSTTTYSKDKTAQRNEASKRLGDEIRRNMSRTVPPRPNTPPPRQQNPYGDARNRNGNGEQPKKRINVVALIIGGFVLLQVVIPLFATGLFYVADVVENFGDKAEDTSTSNWLTDEESVLSKDEDEIWYSFNYGEDAELRALAETGSEVDETLGYGAYEVGVHIPEGTYNIVCLDNCTFYVEDVENNRNIIEYLGDESVGVTSTEIDLYNGSVISIGDGSIQFLSSNGNVDAMYGIENENTDTIILDDILVVGEDIEAGFYDISVNDGNYGSIVVSKPDEKIALDEEGAIDIYNYEVGYLYRFYLSCTDWEVEEGSEVQTVWNVYLPDGTEIGIGSSLESCELTACEVSPPETSWENWLEISRN